MLDSNCRRAVVADRAPADHSDPALVYDAGLISASGGYETPTPGPTPTLPSWVPSDLATFRGSATYTITKWVDMSQVVAEVVVERIDDARFNTQNGALPTQDPNGDTAGLEIFRPVVLSVVDYWKGADTELAGFVAREDGGSLLGYTFKADPGPILLPGRHGIAFLSIHPQEELQGLEPV